MNSTDLTGNLDKETVKAISEAIKNEVDISEEFEKKEVPRATPVVPRNKIGRNQPCPCGSQKKYKKCCLLKRTYTPGG